MSREQILAKIRAGLGHEYDDGERRAAARAYIAGHERHLIPERGRLPRPELLAQFRALLEGQSAAVLTAEGPASVPRVVARYLIDSKLPPRVRTGVDPWLNALPWAESKDLEIVKGPAEASDPIGLSHALAGVSESGTLILASGADNPVTLTFLPETHVIIVGEDDIVGSLEDGFDHVRARFGKGRLPRTLNLVSGASRTADIGGRIVIGAHGPRRLAVVIVKNAKGA